MKITLTAASLPSSFKSLNLKTSAIMKPFSKSVWMTDAAYGALIFFFIVQDLTSSFPTVK